MIKRPTDVRQEEFDTRQLLLSTNRRLLGALAAASVAALAACVAIALLTPLKKVVPYVVHVDKTTGEVTVPAQVGTAQFEPAWFNIEFFLRRWLSDVFVINQYLTVQVNDPRAQAILRGQNAIAEFKAFRSSDQTYVRLTKDPTMVRNVNIRAIAPVAGTKNGAVATVELSTIKGGQESHETVLVTAYYILVPPASAEEARDNPIGLFITDFKVSAR